MESLELLSFLCHVDFIHLVQCLFLHSFSESFGWSRSLDVGIFYARILNSACAAPCLEYVCWWKADVVLYFGREGFVCVNSFSKARRNLMLCFPDLTSDDTFSITPATLFLRCKILNLGHCPRWWYQAGKQPASERTDIMPMSSPSTASIPVCKSNGIFQLQGTVALPDTRPTSLPP